MPQASRTFRIFVSSTFEDLKEERHALQQYVFPRLRDICQRYGTRFQAIDLRWGVSEEASLDQKTIKVCLEEVERCQRLSPRPNFLVLLGDRYGWRPLPSEIPADRFERIKDSVGDPKDLRLLEQWYRRDDNALYRQTSHSPSQALYVLQPRSLDLAAIQGRERRLAAVDSEARKWSQTEAKLRRILQSAAAAGSDSEDSGSDFLASACELEIARGALKSHDPLGHVFCFFRTIEDLPEDERARPFRDIDSNTGDLTSDRQLEKLKEKLRTALPGQVHEPYRSRWTGKTITLDHIGTLPGDLDACLRLLSLPPEPPSTLCEDIFCALGRVILSEIEGLQRVDSVQRETRVHRDFGAERARHFTGRQKALRRMTEYLEGDDRHLLGVLGPSGSGKSALMAKVAQLVRLQHPEAEIVLRFIGATPESSEGRSLLQGLCQEISRLFAANESSIPRDYEKLQLDFRDLLRLAEKKQRLLIILLDGVDQLQPGDRARNLRWIPSQLPSYVRFVVSAVTDGGENSPSGAKDVQSAAIAGLSDDSLIELTAMSADDGEELLNLWFSDAGRTLQIHQKREVLTRFRDEGLPLYLKLAFEEARRWASYDPPERTRLAPSVTGIIRENLLGRLSSERNHGALVVSRSLAFLAAARNGLTEDEILDLLSADPEVLEDFRRRYPRSPKVQRLPVVVWSRLQADLEPYLTEREADGTLLTGFYHRQLLEVVQTEYLTRDKQRHRELADYFSYDGEEGSPNGEHLTLRQLSELPFQLTLGELWERLHLVLSDFFFLQEKISKTGITELMDTAGNRTLEYSGIFQLQQDFALAIEKIPADTSGGSEDPSINASSREGDRACSSMKRDLELIKGALDLSAHVFVGDPGQLAAQLTGRLLSIDGKGPLRLVGAAKAAGKGALLLRTASLFPPEGPLVSTLVGHRNEVSSVIVTGDGQRCVSVSDDGTLRLWDLETGRQLYSVSGAETPPADEIGFHKPSDVALLLGGDELVTKDSRGRGVVWSLETGSVIRVLTDSFQEAPTTMPGGDSLQLAALTPDARLAVCLVRDDTLQLWDLRRKRRTVEFRVSDQITALAMSPDGERAFWGTEDGCVRGRELHTGEELAGFDLGETIVSLGCLCDGHRISLITAGDDLRVRKLDGSEETQWDRPAGEAAEELNVGTALGCRQRRRLVLSPNGRYALWAHWDTVHIIDLELGTEFPGIQAHTDGIRTISFSPSSHRLVTGGSDNTIRVWNLEGLGPASGSSHSSPVRGVAIVPSGTRAVSVSAGEFLHWDLGLEEQPNRREDESAGGTCVAADRTGRLAVSGSMDHSLRLWDLEAGQAIGVLKGHTGSIMKALFDGSGDRILTAAADDTLRIWDVQSRRCTGVLEGHTGGERVDLSLDGRRAVSAGWDKAVHVWNLETCEQEQILCGHEQVVRSVSLTPDGRYAVSASHDRTLRVWSLELGREVLTLLGHWHAVGDLDVAPDGRRAVSIGRDDTLRIWNLLSGEEIGSLEGHRGASGTSLQPGNWDAQVLVAREGSRAVSFISDDLTLRVWDLISQRQLAGFTGEHRIRSIAVDAKGQTILVGDGAGNVHVLRLNEFEGMQERPGVEIERGHGFMAFFRRLFGTGEKKKTEKGVDPGKVSAFGDLIRKLADADYVDRPQGRVAYATEAAFKAKSELISAGEEAVPCVVDCLRGKGPTHQRALAAQVLGEIGARKAVQSLIQALTDSSMVVRGYSAEALGKIGAAEAKGPLQTLLDKRGENSTVKSYAKGALNRL